MNDPFDDHWFEIRKEKAVAFGKEVGKHFMVRAGSTAMREGTPNEKRDRPKRDSLVSEGVLVSSNDAALFVFSRDYLFSSKSLAAGVVIDGNSNGSHWRPRSDSPAPEWSSSTLTRDLVEAAIVRFEELGPEEFAAKYPLVDRQPDCYLRSSKPDATRLYPTDPVVALALERPQLESGWANEASACSTLYNAGLIVTGPEGQPVRPPPGKAFLIGDAQRTRLCALNYYILPARENLAPSVVIRAGTLHDEMGLNKAWANVCQALRGEMFLELANVEAPVVEGPPNSTTTTFSFRLENRVSPETAKIADPTNLILYGPPGTGKTYRSAYEAVRLCLGPEEALRLNGDRDTLMRKYRELEAEGRIEFVTFHQSFAYEDFVEGLRPETSASASASEGTGDTNSSGFRLEPHPGVFRRICERAQEPKQIGGDVFDPRGRSVFKMSLGEARSRSDEYLFEECIANGYALLGWSVGLDWTDARYASRDVMLAAVREVDGHSTEPASTPYVTFSDRWRNRVSIGDVILISRGNSFLRAIGVVESDYFFDADRDDYKNHGRRVSWLWSSHSPASDVAISEFFPRGFNMKSLYEMNASEIDWSVLNRHIVTSPEAAALVPHVLVIDEINRANISKVFGELITLLEGDKRLGRTNAVTVRLPYSKQKFGVPANLHIVGTMNTADRSIALLDTALRRRFTFEELLPDPGTLPADIGGINLQEVLRVLNDRIEFLFDREHQIGHAYFHDCKTVRDVENAFRHKIIPLLAEYFYEDWGKIALVLGEKVEFAGHTYSGRFLDGRKLTVKGFEQLEGRDERVRWRVKAEFDLAGFVS